MYEHDFCEYAVRKQTEGKYLAAVCLTSVAAVLFAVLYLLFGVPRFDITINLLILAAFGVGVWYLSRFTYIEYEYSQTCTVFDAAAVYSRQYRREKASIDLKTATSIAPYKGRFPGGAVPRKVLDLRSSAASPNAYAIVYADDKGETRALLFDANKTVIDNIYHYCPSVTVRSDGLPE